MEQEFSLARIEKLLPEASKEDIITVFLALQRQVYCLGNTVKNLVKSWPTTNLESPPTTSEGISLYGISFEIKD
jgi:hypothetical protein